MPRKMSKALEKKVRSIVKDEQQEELEDKVAVIGFNQTNIDTAAIPSGDVSASSNFIKLLPNIPQGNGQYNNRIGNEIRLKEIDIKMLLQYREGDSTSSTNYIDQTVGVRVMILRQKDNNDQVGFVEDAQTSKLLENGSIITPGPSNFSGSTINLVQKINREQFSVRYDKVFYLDRSRRFNDGSGALQFNRPPRPVVMSHKLKFGKQGLKLTFGNAASENPTNFPYVMVVGYASTESSTVPSNNLLTYTYTANSVYTDA